MKSASAAVLAHERVEHGIARLAVDREPLLVRWKCHHSMPMGLPGAGWVMVSVSFTRSGVTTPPAL